MNSAELQIEPQVISYGRLFEENKDLGWGIYVAPDSYEFTQDIIDFFQIDETVAYKFRKCKDLYTYAGKLFKKFVYVHHYMGLNTDKGNRMYYNFDVLLFEYEDLCNMNFDHFLIITKYFPEKMIYNKSINVKQGFNFKRSNVQLSDTEKTNKPYFFKNIFSGKNFEINYTNDNNLISYVRLINNLNIAYRKKLTFTNSFSGLDFNFQIMFNSENKEKNILIEEDEGVHLEDKFYATKFTKYNLDLVDQFADTLVYKNVNYNLKQLTEMNEILVHSWHNKKPDLQKIIRFCSNANDKELIDTFFTYYFRIFKLKFSEIVNLHCFNEANLVLQSFDRNELQSIPLNNFLQIVQSFKNVFNEFEYINFLKDIFNTLLVEKNCLDIRHIDKIDEYLQQTQGVEKKILLEIFMSKFSVSIGMDNLSTKLLCKYISEKNIIILLNNEKFMSSICTASQFYLQAMKDIYHSKDPQNINPMNLKKVSEYSVFFLCKLIDIIKEKNDFVLDNYIGNIIIHIKKINVYSEINENVLSSKVTKNHSNNIKDNEYKKMIDSEKDSFRIKKDEKKSLKDKMDFNKSYIKPCPSDQDKRSEIISIINNTRSTLQDCTKCLQEIFHMQYKSYQYVYLNLFLIQKHKYIFSENHKFYFRRVFKSFWRPESVDDVNFMSNILINVFDGSTYDDEADYIYKIGLEKIGYTAEHLAIQYFKKFGESLNNILLMDDQELAEFVHSQDDGDMRFFYDKLSVFNARSRFKKSLLDNFLSRLQGLI